jgi:hypothetical protein
MPTTPQLTLEPGAYGASQRNLAAMGLDLNAIVVDFVVALEPSYYFLPEFVRPARGLSAMLFNTPFTPLTRRATFSAVPFWHCHSTSPSSVAQPAATTTLMVSKEIGSRLLVTAWTPAIRSDSATYVSVGFRTNPSV